MRKFGKTDSNQTEIVCGLKKLGISVFSIASLGNGHPDIVVGHKGKNFLFEIKNGNKPPSQRKLTDMEIIYFETWGGQVNIAMNLDEVLKVIGLV